MIASQVAVLAPNDLESQNQGRSPFRVIDVLVEVLSGCLPNTSQMHYYFSQLARLSSALQTDHSATFLELCLYITFKMMNIFVIGTINNSVTNFNSLKRKGNLFYT